MPAQSFVGSLGKKETKDVELSPVVKMCEPETQKYQRRRPWSCVAPISEDKPLNDAVLVERMIKMKTRWHYLSATGVESEDKEQQCFLYKVFVKKA